MVNSAAAVQRRLARSQPASFDVLAVGSVDVRPMRWTARRRRLESLDGKWAPPLQLSPVTSDVEEAEEWLEAFKASGVEGLVVKGAATRYQPGRRDWVKVNSVGVGGVRLVHRRDGSWEVRKRVGARWRYSTRGGWLTLRTGMGILCRAHRVGRWSIGPVCLIVGWAGYTYCPHNPSGTNPRG
jgi:hypothetical protein